MTASKRDAPASNHLGANPPAPGDGPPGPEFSDHPIMLWEKVYYRVAPIRGRDHRRDGRNPVRPRRRAGTSIRALREKPSTGMEW